MLYPHYDHLCSRTTTPVGGGSASVSRSGQDPGYRTTTEVLRRWASAGYAFARRHLAGQQVGLELDVQDRDEFGRLPAYVWVGRVLFNLELVREGYAWSYPVPPNLRYAELLAACQRQAQQARRGLWGY